MAAQPPHKENQPTYNAHAGSSEPRWVATIHAHAAAEEIQEVLSCVGTRDCCSVGPTSRAAIDPASDEGDVV